MVEASPHKNCYNGNGIFHEIFESAYFGIPTKPVTTEINRICCSQISFIIGIVKTQTSASPVTKDTFALFVSAKGKKSFGEKMINKLLTRCSASYLRFYHFCGGWNKCRLTFRLFTADLLCPVSDLMNINKSEAER